MSLVDLGWNASWSAQFAKEARQDCVPARVVEELKGLYRVSEEGGTYLAEVSGRMQHGAEGRMDFPAIGDWAVTKRRPGEKRAAIVAILPRATLLLRKVAGPRVSQQILAANLDTVFIVGSLNRELNLRRIERYLALAWQSGARPVIVLNKADLCGDPAAMVQAVRRVAPGAAVHSLSAVTGVGLETLHEYLASGQTAAFIGTSGVGKSTIINALAQEATQRVQPVRESDDRGKHTTTSRQLFVLAGGGIVIDTPGMRELQLWESGDGVSRAFEEIDVLAEQCRFRDCRHRGEPGCAVERAIVAGSLTRERLENRSKLEGELRFLERKGSVEARQAEKRRVKRLQKRVREMYRSRKSGRDE
jgi:ribosome biogenesis GTPase / thiamine phosphate phosphatase